MSRHWPSDRVSKKPSYDAKEIQACIKKGTKAWADVPDAVAWVRKMRGDIGMCSWDVDVLGGWEGDCGIRWSCEFETPADNGMNFCPRCGKRLEQKGGEK